MSTQVTTTKEILSWIDTYIVSIAAIGIGLFFFFHHVARPHLKTPNDVVYVEGKVTNYSFQPKPGQRAALEQYYIWLDNYACTFQIKADYLSYFYRSRFERDIKKGDTIRISIPKVYVNHLQDRKRKIFILSVNKDSAQYLRLTETIPKPNDYFDIYAGLFFLIAGGIYYFAKKKSIVKFP
jgi:hypothetical protein